jgi:hypothetical protein
MALWYAIELSILVLYCYIQQIDVCRFQTKLYVELNESSLLKIAFGRGTYNLG